MTNERKISGGAHFVLHVKVHVILGAKCDEYVMRKLQGTKIYSAMINKNLSE
jgi:hypothetical protein